MDLPCGLARGVLDPLHSLPGLIGDATKGTLTLLVLALLVLPLLLLIAFAHFSSPFGKATMVLGQSYPTKRGPKTPCDFQGRFELPRFRGSCALLLPCLKRR